MSAEVNSLWQFSESIWDEPGVFRILSAYPKLDVFIIFNTKKTSSVLRPKIFRMSEFKVHVKSKQIIPVEDTLSCHSAPLF